jgi:predicted enzyme related to lactoylglutathione lyase
MANPVGAFIWYELMTTDPEGAAAFYGPIVGWTIAAHSGPETGQETGMDYRMIGRSDGGFAGGVLKLTDEMRQGGARPLWIGYLYVTSVDEAVAAIVADGGKEMMAAMDIEVGRIAMVTDPQGVPYYVMTPKPPAHAPDASSDVYDRYAEQRVAWNELMSPDLDAAKAFYARHHNFEFNEVMPMGPMGDYCFIDHGGETIGAVMQKSEEMPCGLWNFYIRVPEIRAATAKVKELGGQVFNGPMEVPGGDWIINGMDPQGAMFSLVAAKSSGGA